MTAMMNLLGRDFGDLTVKRDLYLDGTTFHCICKCDRYRTVTREQLLSKCIKSCAYCAKQARHAANKPQVEVIKPEPLAKITLPDCAGCTIRMVGGVRYRATQPDCPRHSPMFGNAGFAYPRSTLTAPSSIGGGRNMHKQRKVANE